MNKINWVVWDSCAYGAYGWESSWTDTCGTVGFETLAEAWSYYLRNQGNDGYGANGCIIEQWCTKPESVIARCLNIDNIIID